MKKMSSIKKVVKQVFINYFEHNVGKNAAALAYYLLFAIFPLLIFISNFLGLLDLDVHSITRYLGRILPPDIVNIVETYLDHITYTSNHVLLWFSLVFSIWFPMRAVRGLMADVRRAYELEEPKKPIAYAVKQFLYTVVFLVVIVLTLFLSVLGENVLGYINNNLPQNWHISEYLLEIWQYLRFVIVAFLMLFSIGSLYSFALDKRPPVKKILPGIFGALLSWMVVSVGFSFYAENFANYSIIYGTLGAVMVLLVWLYMTALVLILGAELNAAIQKFSVKKN
ncbi:MAG: YihY/virulence factor BrkB family protein [Ruminococcaceae bacterium]|nr:YihY/virulence factor BrkB family protein [Oscillospiraceae bacterium]